MKKEKFIVLFAVLLIWQGINAQVVNIEKKRKGDTDGFQGVVGLGFQFLDNGKKVMQFTNNIDLQYKTGPHVFLLINDLSLMSVDDENIVNSGFQHIRYNYTVRDSSFLTLELLAQHQYNPIKLLSRRLIAGIGPRFRILNTDKATFYFGSPILFEHEELSDINSSVTELIRLDMYASVAWQVTKHFKLGSITYFQPVIKRFADYRISSETIFTFEITDKLAFNTGFEATFDSEPPDDIQKLFIIGGIN